MRTILKYVAALSLITFIIAWGVGGVNILNNNFDNFAWAYVGAVSFVVFSVLLFVSKQSAVLNAAD